MGFVPPCPVACPIPSPRPHLREEPAGAAPSVEHPLGEESAELAAGERPAPHPAAERLRCPPQQVRLPGLLRCRGTDGSARDSCQPGCREWCWQGHPPTPAGTGCCMQEPPAPQNSPQLLPRRAPLAQCKGEERGVTAARGSAPTQGRAGAPNHHSPTPDSRGCPHASYPSRIKGLDMPPGISYPIPTPAQSWASPNPSSSQILALGTPQNWEVAMLHEGPWYPPA